LAGVKNEFNSGQGYFLERKTLFQEFGRFFNFPSFSFHFLVFCNVIKLEIVFGNDLKNKISSKIENVAFKLFFLQ